MLERLRLANFQSWDAVDLPLSAVTVIIGETNAGKSALLRALSCLLFNAMEGSAMVRHGAKVAEVELECEGHTLGWARGATINRFVVDGQVYDKPGRAVPPAVGGVTGITELEFDGESVRMQWASQMDAPFLLADSGAKATRMLGVAGKAAVVAQAARLAQAETRDCVAAVTAAEIQVDRLRQELHRFDFVPAAAPFADRVKSGLSELLDVRSKRALAADVLNAYQAVVIRGAVLSRQESAAQRIAQLRFQQVNAMTDRVLTRQYLDGVSREARVSQLETLALRVAGARVEQVRVLAARDALASWRALRAMDGAVTRALAAAEHVVALRRMLEQAGGIRAALVSWGQLQQRVQESDARLRLAIADHQSQHRGLEALLVRVTCPTCGQVRAA